MGIVLGLASGVWWGCADFFGGLASRRMSAAAVALISQVIGAALVVVALLVTRPTLPPWGHLGLGAIGGVCGGLGLYAFYRALAVGTMSLIAPVSALGAGVPIAFGLLDGERPSALALAGALTAVAGAVLASHAPGDATRQGLGLAVVAAVMFGLFFALIEPAARTDVFWAALSTRASSVPILVIVCLATGAALRVSSGSWGFIVVAGVLDVSANVAFAAATQHGLLSIVSALGGLYPVATVVLAQVVLGERLSVGQTGGVLVALTGVTLIASG